MVITDGWSKQEIEELKGEAVAICRQERGGLERSFQNASTEAEFATATELKAMDGDEAIKHFLCIHQPNKTSPTIHRHLSHPVIVGGGTDADYRTQPQVHAIDVVHQNSW